MSLTGERGCIVKVESENKISLYVRETDLTDGTGKNYREVLINRNEKKQEA